MYPSALFGSFFTGWLNVMFDILVDSAKTTGGIMLIVASASLFSFVCTKFGIANAASELLAGIAHNQFTFLLIVNIIFLILILMATKRFTPTGGVTCPIARLTVAITPNATTS